jgi:hypothetical protein
MYNVRHPALDYVNKVSAGGTEWVSLSRADGEAEWDIDFGDATFEASERQRSPYSPDRGD